MFLLSRVAVTGQLKLPHFRGGQQRKVWTERNELLLETTLVGGSSAYEVRISWSALRKWEIATHVTASTLVLRSQSKITCE